MDVAQALDAGAIGKPASSIPQPQFTSFESAKAAILDAAASGNDDQKALISQALSRLYHTADVPVSVTFEVAEHPNEIVTVFTNAVTGEEIAKYPPDLLVRLAQFFNQLVGAVVDRNA